MAPSELRTRYGEWLAGIEDVEECAGIVRPRDPHARGVLRAVDRATASLLATLRAPGFVRPQDGSAATSLITPVAVARLVLDGMLETEVDQKWVTGPRAHDVVLDAEVMQPGHASGLLALSRVALDYAESLELDDVHKLAWRLYAFNRRPITPACFQTRGSTQAVQAWLGVHQAVTGDLSANWQLDATPDEWLHWWPANATVNRPAGDVIFKLYVSPKTELLPVCLQRSAILLAAHKAIGFKVGSHAHAVQRPDKFVAYFDSLGELTKCAAALAPALAGIPWHGVPFSAALSEDGLLSWGVDPPPDTQLLSWKDGDSWRTWVCERLASYLIAAKRAAVTQIRPAEFALARLSLDGIDTDTWVPDETWLLSLMRRGHSHQ